MIFSAEKSDVALHSEPCKGLDTSCDMMSNPLATEFIIRKVVAVEGSHYFTNCS
jgi:hypothetical protein